MKYRKKPVVIEAIQMTPEMRQNFGPFPEWALLHLTAGKTKKIENSEWVWIDGICGGHPVEDYEYIVKDADGDVFSCSKETFEKTYEPV